MPYILLIRACQAPPKQGITKRVPEGGIDASIVYASQVSSQNRTQAKLYSFTPKAASPYKGVPALAT